MIFNFNKIDSEEVLEQQQKKIFDWVVRSNIRNDKRTTTRNIDRKFVAMP